MQICIMQLLRQYNPFEPLTTERIQQLLFLGQPILVVQRFLWTGITAGAGFMATRYSDVAEAAAHLSHLHPNEGKLVDLHQPAQLNKLMALLAPGSNYQVFINSLKDKDWAKKMRKVYAEDVRNYIRSQTKLKPDRDYGVDVTFSIRFGRVTALINTGQQSLEVPFYDIIK